MSGHHRRRAMARNCHAHGTSVTDRALARDPWLWFPEQRAEHAEHRADQHVIADTATCPACGAPNEFTPNLRA